VLIVGGFATVPPNYRLLRRHLLDRGAARVDIAPLWFPDWLLGSMLGLGPVLRRTGKAIAHTYHEGGRRPIIVVAHSAGGVAARLAMSPVPFHGRVADVASAVGCLVTLGTPHDLAQLSNRYHHAGHDAVEFLDRNTPGAYFAPRTAYLTVGSAGRQLAYPGWIGRASDQIFSMIIGPHTSERSDGVVPESAAHLEGAEKVSLTDVSHGTFGSDWYGADAVVDRWWPKAVELWQGALAARRAEPSEGPLAESGVRP